MDDVATAKRLAANAAAMPEAGPEASVIAHRGFSAAAPENTLAAFAAALTFGADVVECDVHLSSDCRVMVIHDATVDRTTDGSGAVWSRSEASLRALDAGAGEKIPTLAEVLRLVKGRARVLVELKWPKHSV